MKKKDSSSPPVQIVFLEGDEIERLVRHPKHADLSSRDPDRVARLKEAVLRIGEIIKPVVLSKKGEVLAGWTRVTVAKDLKIRLPVIYLDLSEDAQVEFIAEDNAFDHTGSCSDHFRAVATLWETCGRTSQGELGGHVATKERETKTRERVAAKYGRISPRQVQRYHSTLGELHAADSTAWERIKDRDDCYEEALRIIKAHKANTEAEPEPAAAAATDRIDQKVQRTLKLIEKVLAAAQELQALSSNLRLDELQRLRALFENFAALVAAIERKRAEAQGEQSAALGRPLLEEKR
jgi:hypothetical protein